MFLEFIQSGHGVARLKLATRIRRTKTCALVEESPAMPALAIQVLRDSQVNSGYGFQNYFLIFPLPYRRQHLGRGIIWRYDWRTAGVRSMAERVAQHCRPRAMVEIHSTDEYRY